MKDIIYSDQELLKINYAKQVIKNEFLKLATLLIVFYLFGDLHLFLISLMTLLVLRVYTGGIHYHSQVGCWIITFIFFFIAINSSLFFAYEFMSVTYVISFVACLLTILLVAPIESPYRPMKDEGNRRKFKIMAIIVFVITWALLHLLTNNPRHLTVGLNTLNLQCIQLIYVKARKLWEVKHERN